MAALFRFSNFTLRGLLIFAAGLAVTALVAWEVQRANQHNVEAAVAAEMELISADLLSRIQLYQYGLRGARGYILTAGEYGTTREGFRRYSETRDLEQEFPGARGFGFVRRVPRAQESLFLEHARADIDPAFVIRELAPHEAERYLIEYVEPMTANAQAVGLDIASEANRREAALAAMRSGEARLTGPITLVQAEGNPQQSFLILMPVYRTGVTPASLAERESEAFGWSYAPLVTEEVLAGLRLDIAALQLRLQDVTDAAAPVEFFATAAGTRTPLFTQVEEREVFGRRWSIALSVHPLFVQRMRQLSPLLVLGLGLLVSTLAAVLSLAIGRERYRQRQLAAERELRRLNRWLANVLNAASEVAIIATDRAGNITLFNTGAERMLGYRADELIGHESPARLHLEQEVRERGRELSAEYGQSIQGFSVFVYKPELEGSETRQWTYVRKDGVELQVSLCVTSMCDEQGDPIGYLGIAIDITEELRGKRQLLAARDQLVIAAEVAELGVWSWTLKDNSLQWNDRMFEIYAQPKSLRETGLNYAHWRARVHPEDRAATEAKLAAAVAGQGVYDPVFRILLPGGRLRYIQAAAQVERDAQGQVERVTGINRDISLQRELENSLQQAKAAADAASAAKSSFLANMSHEIRTPMNAVLGMLELVQKTSLDARQRDYILKARNAAKSLLELLNDILDFSKIDAGKLELDPHPFELEPLLRDLAVILAGNLGDKEVTIIFDLAPALPRVLEGDRLRLQQVLINLTGNALKFTAAGEVVVQIAVLERQEAQVRLHIAVTDTGIGIAPAQLERLFQGFVQGEASTTRRYGGTGLGLAICKQLVGMMGGELQVASEVGKGSRFFFDLWLKSVDARRLGEVTFNSLLASAAALPQKPQVPAQPLRGMRLLVIEDNALNRQVAEELLAGLGARVDLAQGGLQGVAKVMADPQAYDAVLMDIQMPDVDGFEATRRLRANPHCASLPILAMTANASAEDKTACLSAGMQDHIAKPLDSTQLAATLQAWIRPGGAQYLSVTETAEVDLTENTTALLRRFGGNRELLRRVLRRFREEMQQLLGDLAERANAEDATGAAAILHSIKGLAANLGAVALAAVAGALERELKAERNPRLLEPACLASLQALLDRSNIALLRLVEDDAGETERQTGWKPMQVEVQLGSRLAALKPLLLAGNLGAIELAALLATEYPADARLAQLREHAQALDFAAAMAILEVLDGELKT